MRAVSPEANAGTAEKSGELVAVLVAGGVASTGALGDAVRELIAVGVTRGAVVFALVVDVFGVSTVSIAWITPFVASKFRAWTDAPLILRPPTSVNNKSSPVNAFLLGADARLPAITLPGKM